MPAYTQKLLPGLVAPSFEGTAIDGQRWLLEKSPAPHFTLLVFYRGAFCSYCRRSLQEFDRLADQFGKRGVDLLFVSADAESQARFAIDSLDLKNLRICYGLTVQQMEQWGVFMSAGSSAMKQAAVFSEPALFLIKEDMTLLYQVLNSAPFARPAAQDIIEMLDFMEEKKAAYPQRGGWTPANLP